MAQKTVVLGSIIVEKVNNLDIQTLLIPMQNYLAIYLHNPIIICIFGIVQKERINTNTLNLLGFA